jgi:pilus assembly protein TadC
MGESKNKHGLINMIREGLNFISQMISTSIFPPIAEGAEMVIKTIENKIILIENRIIKKVTTLLIIGFGGLFLIFALLFYLIDIFGWSKAAAYFSIGIIIFITGLIMKVAGYDK